MQSVRESVSLIEAAQIDALFARARLVFSVNVINSVIVAAFLWNAVPTEGLLAWVAAMLAVTGVRYRLLLDYQKDAAKDLLHWRRIALWGAAASGIIWGAAALLLFPQHSLLHQIFLLVVVMGMLAGAATSWHAHFQAFQAYFLPAAGLTLIRFVLEISGKGEDSSLFFALGALFVLFGIGLYILAKKSNQMLAQMLLAQCEKQASEDRYRAMFQGAQVPMLLIDPADGRIVDANSAAFDYYGFSELREMNIGQINTASGQEISDKLESARRQRQSGFHFNHRLANGEVRDVEVHSGPVSLGTQQLLYSIVHDITERRRAEESLRLASLVYQSSSEAIMVTDENNLIVEVNPAFTRTTGYPALDVAGRNPSLLQSGRHDREFFRQMWGAILEQGCWQGEIWNRRKNGDLYAQWSNISVIRHPDGKIHRYVCQFSDITEKKQKDEIIWLQANYDMLTNLPNRRLFRDRLEREIKKSKRTGMSLALLFIDLDRFKEINDTMGHNIGDQLLVEAALRISGCVRETDTVARLGGDEFTVILPEFASRVNLERIAQSIIDELGRPFMLGVDAAYISASVGLTLYPDDASDLDGLLKNADQAMYGAKAKGRNRFGYFTESMQREVHEKLALTNDLRSALARNELEVYYQPICEVKSGRIVKAEALLRWKHGERGMVGPDQFIPLAEESGLIMEIGEWVFGEAVSSVERWRNKLGRIVPVSVNKSPIQFADESKGMAWPDRLVSQGLPGNSIAVEITEGMLLKELSKVKERLLAFRSGGIEVSIDDFGTGFSSLAYLQQFDIDYLKIDRSFISCLTENENDKALTEAIIVMAHKLGIRTIAEGVETEKQRELLTRFGCDFAQGYLYSRAVPGDEFERLLEKEVSA